MTDVLPQSHEGTTLFLVSLSQLLICALVFNLDSLFRQPMHTNIPLVVLMALNMAVYFAFLFAPHEGPLQNWMSLAYNKLDYSIRLWILALNVANLITAVTAHILIQRGFARKASKRGKGPFFMPPPQLSA